MSVRETRLDNGLRIVTEKRKSLQTLCAGLWVAAGARHESDDTSGLAHCLEHMVFKGTETRSAQQIALEIERVGGHMNAYTTRDNTCFYARTLAEDAALAIDLLADVTLRPTFDEAEFEREKGVILQELGQAEDTPDDIIFDELQRVAFGPHPLGRSILGSEQSIRDLKVSDLRQFMLHHYKPDNQVFSAVGNVEHDQIVDLVATHFGAGEAGTISDTDSASFSGGCWSDVRDLEQVHLALAFDGVSFYDPEYYAMQVYTTLLGGGMSSRLFQEVREKRGLAYSVYSFASSHRDAGLMGLYAGTSLDRVEELVHLLKAELARVPSDLSGDEIDVAKAQLKSGLMMALESTTSRMEQLGRHLLLYDRVLPVDEILADVDRVSAKDLAALSTLYADPPKTALAVIGEKDLAAIW